MPSIATQLLDSSSSDSNLDSGDEVTVAETNPAEEETTACVEVENVIESTPQEDVVQSNQPKPNKSKKKKKKKKKGKGVSDGRSVMFPPACWLACIILFGF